MDANYDLRQAFGLWGWPDGAGEWLVETLGIVYEQTGDGDPDGVTRLYQFYGWSYADVMDTPYTELRRAGRMISILSAEEHLAAIADRQGQAEYVNDLKARLGPSVAYASLGEYFAGIE